MTKMQRRRRNKEFGIKLRRTLFGKKIKKIKCPNKKKVKRLIFNGKRSLNYPFLKQAKFKMKEKLVLPNKVGLKEENSDTVGEKPRKEVHKAILNLKTTKQRPSKKDLKRNLSKKLQKERNLEDPAKGRENQKEDDIF